MYRIVVFGGESIMSKLKYIFLSCVLILLGGCSKSQTIEVEPQNIVETDCASIHYIEDSLYYLRNGKICCYINKKSSIITQEGSFKQLFEDNGKLYAYDTNYRLYELKEKQLTQVTNLKEDDNWEKECQLVGVYKEAAIWRTEESWADKEEDIRYSDFYSYNFAEKRSNCILKQGDYSYSYYFEENNLYLYNDTEVAKIDLETKEKEVLYQAAKGEEIQSFCVEDATVVLEIIKDEEESKAYYRLCKNGEIVKIADDTSIGCGTTCYNGFLYYCSSLEGENAKITALNINTGEQQDIGVIAPFSEIKVTEKGIFYIKGQGMERNRKLYFFDGKEGKEVK